jgi:hypothetical protein
MGLHDMATNGKRDLGWFCGRDEEQHLPRPRNWALVDRHPAYRYGMTSPPPARPSRASRAGRAMEAAQERLEDRRCWDGWINMLRPKMLSETQKPGIAQN